MALDTNTKLNVRINKQANSRKIILYITYLEGSNTQTTCLQSHSLKLEQLLHDMKNLDFKGAITVAFECDHGIFALIDEIDPIAKKAKDVRFIILKNSKYRGHYQEGWGLLRSIKDKASLEDKRIVLLGTRHLAAAFLAELRHIILI